MSEKNVEKIMEWLEDSSLDSRDFPRATGFLGYSEYNCAAKHSNNGTVTYRDYIRKRRFFGEENQLDNIENRMIDIALDCGFGFDSAFLRLASGYEYNKKSEDEIQ